MKQNEMLFSVIIPTYNRPQALLRCLRALENQTLNKQSYEIIVVNDGGEPTLLPNASLSDSVAITFLNQKNAGPATARNAGAAVACGKYLAFTDDDFAPDEEWLKSFEMAFSKAPQATMLGGKTTNALTNNAYASASQLLIDFLYGYFQKSQPQYTFYTSNNMAVSRQEFERINGFNSSFPIAAAEDREFAMRWRENEGHLQYVHEAINFHYHQMTFAKYFRQHYNYGKGARLFYQFAGSSKNGNKAKLSPLSFYTQLFASPWKITQSGKQKGIALCGLLFISQLANALGYFSNMKTKSTFTIQ